MFPYGKRFKNQTIFLLNCSLLLLSILDLPLFLQYINDLESVENLVIDHCADDNEPHISKLKNVLLTLNLDF